MKQKKIFLICPVRKKEKNLIKKFLIWLGIIPDKWQEEQERIRKYVEKLEKQGHKVYWPARDTNQDDPIGLRICTDNAKAIIWADEVHIWWNEKSQGSLFDFGMTFVCNILGVKKIILANPNDVKPTDHKSFNSVLLTLHKRNTRGEKE